MGGPNPLAHSIQSPLQQTSQPPSHIPIHRRKRARPAVLEVSIPAAQTPVHAGHDGAQAPSVQTRGLRPHPVFQLHQALLPRPFLAPLEVIPKEVKPAGDGHVDDPRLFRMQRQARFAYPVPHRRQGGLRLGLTATEDHEVVRLAHQFPARRRHLVIQRMEIHVGQQRTDHPALRRAPLGGLPAFGRLQHASPEETFHQRQHPSVGHARFDPREQPVVRNRVEADSRRAALRTLPP